MSYCNLSFSTVTNWLNSPSPRIKSASEKNWRLGYQKNMAISQQDMGGWASLTKKSRGLSTCYENNGDLIFIIYSLYIYMYVCMYSYKWPTANKPGAVHGN